MAPEEQKIVQQVESIIRSCPSPRQAARQIVGLRLVNQPRAITIKEFCFEHRVTRKTVYNWLRRGCIKSIPVNPLAPHGGKRILVS